MKILIINFELVSADKNDLFTYEGQKDGGGGGGSTVIREVVRELDDNYHNLSFKFVDQKHVHGKVLTFRRVLP